LTGLTGVSRFGPQSFDEKHGLLLSASPSIVGGDRGASALRVPFGDLGAGVYLDISRWSPRGRAKASAISSLGAQVLG
jgi:hypothetical protein